MNYQRDLQIRLQERYRRLYKADYKVYQNEIKFLCDYILNTPALAALVERLSFTDQELDPEKWIEEHVGWHKCDWPDTESGRAKIVWWLFNQWAGGQPALDFAHTITGETKFASALREMSEMVIEPFIEYLQERLSAESDILFLLERYTRLVRWFDQDMLFEQYTKDTKHGEAIYERHLRQFLFEQGIDYPFSQPQSPAGKADVISGLDGDDPLVCEVKLFNGNDYGAKYISKGVAQALEYAHDYGKTVAHVVIFNLTDRPLQLPSDDSTVGWPPRLSIAGVTVFLVAVQAFKVTAASDKGHAQTWNISREQLVSLAE